MVFNINRIKRFCVSLKRKIVVDGWKYYVMLFSPRGWLLLAARPGVSCNGKASCGRQGTLLDEELDSIKEIEVPLTRKASNQMQGWVRLNGASKRRKR